MCLHVNEPCADIPWGRLNLMRISCCHAGVFSFASFARSWHCRAVASLVRPAEKQVKLTTNLKFWKFGLCLLVCGLLMVVSLNSIVQFSEFCLEKTRTKKLGLSGRRLREFAWCGCILSLIADFQKGTVHTSCVRRWTWRWNRGTVKLEYMKRKSEP